MTKVKCRIPLLIFFLLLCNLGSFAEETWFNQRVTWKYGKEGLAWKTTIKRPNGQAEYQLILEPLWAVEGGVVALEIVVARPKQPDVNLLGEREKGMEYPFVITVEELDRGLAHSKFGTTRKLQAASFSLLGAYQLPRTRNARGEVAADGAGIKRNIQTGSSVERIERTPMSDTAETSG
jgi:hypothetical protein